MSAYGKSLLLYHPNCRLIVCHQTKITIRFCFHHYNISLDNLHQTNVFNSSSQTIYKSTCTASDKDYSKFKLIP